MAWCSMYMIFVDIIGFVLENEEFNNHCLWVERDNASKNGPRSTSFSQKFPWFIVIDEFSMYVADAYALRR